MPFFIAALLFERPRFLLLPGIPPHSGSSIGITSLKEFLMHTEFRAPRWSGLLRPVLMSALLLIPLFSRAQTFFASGGSTNTAPNNVNLAFGYQSLFSNTTGGANTASGYYALFANTTGSANTAYGYRSLFSNTVGGDNTAFGAATLYSNTVGPANTATGYQALFANTTGGANTANGCYALLANTTGGANTASGYRALQANTVGSSNTAHGGGALYSNISGSNNVANGSQALFSNNGSYNTASGDYALYSNTTGSNNIGIGFGAGQYFTTGNNNIALGYMGFAGESGSIHLGTPGVQTSAYIAGINGVTASGSVPVYINAYGQLGTITSSRRFKNDIQDMGSVSDKLMQLRPVTFRYKDTAEKGTHALQYGLIAEEVAKVYPDLVQYDKEGKPFTIYYHLLTPMLLNELQKAHQQQQAQKTEITTLKTALQKQSAELAALKQSQQQQVAALAKLTELVAASQNKSPLQKAVYTPR